MADRFMVVPRPSAKDFRRDGIDVNRMILYNPIDTQRLLLAAQVCAPPPGVGDGVLVGFAGRTIDNKRIFTLLSARFLGSVVGSDESGLPETFQPDFTGLRVRATAMSRS